VRRYRWMAAGAGVLVLALVLTAAFWPRGRDLPPTRARVYTDASACLLTDSTGITTSPASAVWAGMQSASVRTRTKVSYLAVSGGDSVDNAVPYVNTLVQRKCDLIIAVGADEVAAVERRAATYPATRFAVPGPKGARNISAMAATSADGFTAEADRLVGSIGGK
jgi:basic membrane lipoprotein Med (substrate-binding protein (PBP1-ABC) superfamily)